MTAGVGVVVAVGMGVEMGLGVVVAVEVADGVAVRVGVRVEVPVSVRVGQEGQGNSSLGEGRRGRLCLFCQRSRRWGWGLACVSHSNGIWIQPHFDSYRK